MIGVFLPLIYFIWYNFHAFSLSGNVNSGESETFYAPEIIEVAKEASAYTLNPESNVYLQAGKKISFYSGFNAKLGSKLTAKTEQIDNCNLVFDYINYLKNKNRFL